MPNSKRNRCAVYRHLRENGAHCAIYRHEREKEKKKLKVNENCNFCSHLLENQLRKYKGIGSYFPERVDILLCIINHLRIICSNQMNKKRCFQGLNFKARNHVINKCYKTKANRFLRYPEMTG